MEAGALRKLIYNATKVDIVNANNEFKSTYQILLEISKVWEDLDDMTQATLLEKIAGKHRASVVASLLNDSETMVSAYEDALKSAGSAEEEYLKRTESVEFHLKQLNAAWQELSTNAASVEFINGIIDKVRQLIELINDLGVGNVAGTLIGAVAGVGTQFKLLPFLEGVGEEAKQKNEQIKILGKNFDLLSKKGPKAAGAIKLIVSSLKGLIFGAAGMVALFGVLKFVDYVIEKYNKWQNEASDTADEVKTLESKLKNLNSEFDLLSGKENLTDVEKERLEVLKDEIALQEADLELSKQRLAELNSEKYSGKMTAINYDTGYTKEIEVDSADEQLAKKIDDSTGTYLSSTIELRNLREELNSANEAYKRAAKGTELYAERGKEVSEIGKKISEVESQKSTALEEAKTNYDSLLTQQSELENILQNSVDLTEDEIASYEDKLAVTKSDIELQKILLGLEGANADFGKQQIELYDTYEKTTDIINDLNIGHEISREKLAHLEKEFPGLIDATLKYGDEANGAYTLSKESLETLNSVHATSLSNMNDNELARTIVAKENALKRVAMYQAEATAIGQLSQAMANIQGGNQGLLNEAKNADTLAGKVAGTLKWAAAATQTASVEQYKPFIDSKANGINEKLNDAQAEADAYAKQIEEIIGLINGIDPTKTGNGTEDGDLPGDGNGPGSGDDDKIDLWDKYANAIEKITQKLEQYDKAIESTESALDLNQSYEERSLELMSEEYDLYGDLIEQYTNKSVAQQEALAATNELIAEMYARLKELTGVDMSNMTQAEMDEWLNTNLSKKELDSIRGQEIKQIIDALATALDTQHDWNMQVDETKSKLNELNRSQVNIKINFQNDVTEKFEESRESAEKVLDILEEIEGTEQRRSDLLDALNDSYETEFSQNLKMYDETIKDLQGMEKGSDAYNDTLEEAYRLEQRNLDVIKEQLDNKLRQIEAQRELAYRLNEEAVYGEQGQDAWEKSRENEIDRLQNQLDALDEDTSEADYLEELEDKEETIRKLEEKLANLQRERTVKQLKQEEDGSWQWEYVVDDRAIAETQSELDDARKDLQKTKDDKALEDQKDAIQNRIDAIEDEIESRAERLDLMNQQDAEFYDEQERMAQEHAEKQVEIMNDRTTKTVQALNNLETKTRSGLKEVDKATAQGLSDLSDTYSERLGSMSSMISSWVGEIIDEFNRLQAAQRAAREEAEGMVGASYVASVASGGTVAAGGIKFVEANNFHARLHYGERVLTRQEAAQYNELEEDIKSGKLEAYFNSLREDTAMSFSDAATASVMRTTSMPTTNSNTTSFVIEHLELPEVKDPTDFARVIDNWARGEFGGMAQRARIVKAK